MTVRTLSRDFLLLLLPAIVISGCGPQTHNQEPTAKPFLINQGGLGIMATLPDGRVVTQRTTLRDPKKMSEVGPPQPVYLRYSDDNGLNWTEADTVFYYPAGKGNVSHGILLVDQKGWLHCFALHFVRLPRDTPGFSQVLHNVSEDGGKTWRESQVIDYGHDYSGSLNAVIELSSGRILFAVSYNTEFMEERGEPDNQIVSVYSDDSGITWQVGSDDVDVPQGEFGGHPGALEPVMVELQDGRVWMIIRTQQRRFYQAFSSDRGETWSETSPTDFDAPNAPGGILRLTDGRLVFCWNDLDKYPEGKVEGSGRQYLHIAISGDNGKTWSSSRLIAQREEGELPNTAVAYPFLEETADNHILVSYHRVGNKEGVSWWHPNVEVLRIDPDWIEIHRDQQPPPVVAP